MQEPNSQSASANRCYGEVCVHELRQWFGLSEGMRSQIRTCSKYMFIMHAYIYTKRSDGPFSCSTTLPRSQPSSSRTLQQLSSYHQASSGAHMLSMATMSCNSCITVYALSRSTWPAAMCVHHDVKALCAQRYFTDALPRDHSVFALSCEHKFAFVAMGKLNRWQYNACVCMHTVSHLQYPDAYSYQEQHILCG